MKSFTFWCLLALSTALQGQTLQGQLSQHAGQELRLLGFAYYQTIHLATTVADSLGHFVLTYPKDYVGMGILKAQNQASALVVLSEKKVVLSGTHLNDLASLTFFNSPANTHFGYYAKAQGLYANAQSAWQYLDKLYTNEVLFNGQKKLQKTIQKEQLRLQKEEAAFVAGLDQKSYVRWYIPYRKAVQEMPGVVRRHTERIPAMLHQFRTTNFNQPHFKTSGLFREYLEGHYLLIENMGQPLDSVYRQMNLSTQHLLDNLQANDTLLPKVAKNLFNYFEKRSLYKAAAYLSRGLLNNFEGMLDPSLVAQLESYRKLKVGATAPDILLQNNTKLSAIKTRKLLVFGASWCPACKKELPELLANHAQWKSKNTTIVYISIDTDARAFETTYEEFPWQSFCDFKGWETQAAKDYLIFGTPSYFLLGANNQILLRPKSVAHLNAWMQTHLKD